MRISTLTGTLLVPALLVTALSSSAQTQLDFSFQPQEIYQPAPVYTARQFTDGSRVVAGLFIRTSGGTPVPRVARFLPNGTLDAVFNANVANNAWNPNIVEEFPDGKILVSNSGGSMTISGQVRNGLARLNPDGTLDQTYQANVQVDGYLDGLFIQPDGKVVFSGYFTTLNGQPAHHLARLNADGTVDAAFMAALAAGFNEEVYALARQADGKIVAGGFFGEFNGQARQAVVRLNADGTLDPSFDLHITDSNSYVESLAVQADGKVLIGGGLQTSGSSFVGFKRVLPSGADDASFVGDSQVSPRNYYNTSSIQVQADQKILLVNGSLQYAGQSVSQIVRLLPNGALDNSFQSPVALYSVGLPYSIQPLAGGQVLVGGPTGPYAGRTATPVGLAVLNANGSYNPGFAPVLQSGGTVSDFVQQADGKIVVGGSFTEIGGTAVSNLARLNADGTLDAAYSANALTLGGTVSKLVLQPDGKVLAGGGFSLVGGASRAGLARLLPSGAPDAGFVANLQPTSVNSNASVAQLGLQPSGKVLLAGSFVLPGTFGSFVRVTATGQADASFQVTGATSTPAALLVQPDGRILVGGYYRPASTTYYLRRLLPDGGLDPNFALTSVGNTAVSVSALGLQANGRILVGGRFTQYGSVATAGVARFQADGTPDASFVSGLPTTVNTPTVRVLAVQPNQRVLFASPTAAYATGRLLPTGGLDFSYAYTQGPAASVLQIGVQPDGKLLMGGTFTRVGGQPFFAFTRLTDPNVLSVGARQEVAHLEAYPNPVREQLTLRLDAAARPRHLALTDLRGRLVREQTVVGAEAQVSVRGLTAGVYLLRVDYAAGPVTRRIVVE